MPSSNPEQSVASKSLVSVPSLGPGSCEDVTSPSSLGNESGSEPGNLGLNKGSLPLRHQNVNSSVSPCSSELSSEGSPSTNHLPQEIRINGMYQINKKKSKKKETIKIRDLKINATFLLYIYFYLLQMAVYHKAFSRRAGSSNFLGGEVEGLGWERKEELARNLLC